MRFLKNKIAKAQISSPDSNNIQVKIEESAQEAVSDESEQEWVPNHSKRGANSHNGQKSPPKRRSVSCDNIIKNYGRALTMFAISKMAEPYLSRLTNRYDFKLKAFRRFVKLRKKAANCIRKIREMLPMSCYQNDANYVYKQVFQEVSIIFLKFFCINWLYNSKINEKVEHLNYRFKIQRRIKDPEHFTYLRDFHHF